MSGYKKNPTRTSLGHCFPGMKTLTAAALAVMAGSSYAADANLLDRDRDEDYTITATNSDLFAPISRINDGRFWTSWSNFRSPTYYNDVINIDFNEPARISGIMLHGCLR